MPKTNELEERLAQIVLEIAETRTIDVPGPEAGTVQIFRALNQLRRHLDRLEDIVSSLIKIRSVTRQEALEAEHAMEDAWDHAVTTAGPGFQTSTLAPRERYAHYNTQCIEQRIAARQAKARLQLVEDTLDIAKGAQFNTVGKRQDLESITRLLTADSLLSR